MQATARLNPTPSPLLQRKCGCGGTCGSCGDKRKKPLDRAATEARTPSEIPPIVHDVLATPGVPLDDATRARMETSFGHDFTRVRVHAGARAAESAQAVDARAYTVGSDIVFNRGAYDTRSSQGTHLLAHELAHVVQQQRGISRRAEAISSPHDASETEADRAADRATSGGAVGSLSGAASGLNRAPCPPAPTHLGDSPPSAACDTPQATRRGHMLHFCVDSDELLAGEEATIAPLVPILNTLRTVEVHGYASPEGPSGRAAAYNLALSCHRAQRVASLLIANGVSASNIRTFQHGGTNEFAGARAPNRVVTIPIPIGGSTPAANHMRLAAVSFLSCAPCNPFTDDGTLGLTPPPTEPPVGSSFRMKHWVDAWVHSSDGRTIDASALTNSGAVAGESGYCGTSTTAAIVRRLGPLSGGISHPVHGEGMVFDSELVTRVNASVPPTLPDAPCGPLGANAMIPPIRTHFRLTLFADGAQESEFLGATTFPFHYLYENGALKMFGGSPVHPAVDFNAWATSTGVSRLEAEVGFKALGRACCEGGTGLMGCPATCGSRGTTQTLPDTYPSQPGSNFLACMGVGASLALRSCTSSAVRCAPAGGTCSPPTLSSNP
jgi:outer membrane protein OmpA-like peptidoglycan-associated protein